MPVFPNSFFAKLGSFNNRDNIKLPSTDVPVINSQVTFSPGAGNTTTNPAGYIYHTFTSTGSLTVGSTITRADVFMIGGGGVGGKNPSVGGGGGSGGGMYATQVTLPAQTYTIIVGAGAATVSGVNPVIAPSSEIRTGIGSTVFIVVGGGRGGSSNSPAQPGGSGGGASSGDNVPSTTNTLGIGHTYSQPVISSGIITSYGFRGGGFGSGPSGGGGGFSGAGTTGHASGSAGHYNRSVHTGTGGIGTNPTPQSVTEFSGNVIGVPSLHPLNGVFGGGGSGGTTDHFEQGLGDPGPHITGHGAGGPGGGGGAGSNGTANTGGGGGGGGPAHANGSGGSGLVVIRYAVPL